MTIMTVYRGGFIPFDREEAEDMIDQRGQIFCHQDRTIAALYGSVGRLVIDTARILDATTAATWAEIGRDIEEARRRGYAGVMYPDDHDWSEDGVETDGAEIAIFSADALIF